MLYSFSVILFPGRDLQKAAGHTLHMFCRIVRNLKGSTGVI